MQDPFASLLRHRILLLGGPITAEVSNFIVAGLLLLDANDHLAPIDLHINSIGGGVADAMAIVDAIRAVQAPVHTICIGQAVSTAVWVLAAGAKAHRAATPNSIIMIREMPFRAQDAAGDTEIYAYQALRDRINAYLAEWTGQPINALPGDRFLTAAEAKGYGIVDHVIEPFVKRRNARSVLRQACRDVSQTIGTPAPLSPSRKGNHHV